MRRKHYYKNAVAALIVLLIVNIYCTLGIAENQTVLDNSPKDLSARIAKSINPFDYGFFSGDTKTDYCLQGRDICVKGDIRTNAGFTLKADKFELCGICESVKDYNLNASSIIVSSGSDKVALRPSDDLRRYFKNNQAVVELPGIDKTLMEDYEIRNKLIYINPSNYNREITLAGAMKSDSNSYLRYSDSTFFIDGSKPFSVNDGTTYYFDGNLRIGSGVTFTGKCTIIASGDIIIDGPGFYTTKGSAFIYSTNKGIRCRTDGQNEIRAIFYAPRGNIAFEGIKATITGKVIANQINGVNDIVSLKSDYLGFESLLKRALARAGIIKVEDVNGDGVINMYDVMVLAESFNTLRGDGRYNEALDLNSDGAINLIDIIIIAGKFNTIV